MELFIQIQNGQPFEHPIMSDNFSEAFPDVDVENLPSEFAKFVRVEMPMVNVYEVYEGVTYELIDGFYRDVHHVRPMTDQERADKINAKRSTVPEEWTEEWTFVEEWCSWEPPRHPRTIIDVSGSPPNVIG